MTVLTVVLSFLLLAVTILYSRSILKSIRELPEPAKPIELIALKKEVEKVRKELKTVISKRDNEINNAYDYNLLMNTIREHIRNSKDNEISILFKYDTCNSQYLIEVKETGESYSTKQGSIIRILADSISKS